ncbi:hypothetical protein [Streptomyces sp. NPDC004284]|uniref:hypothetical protein n=1 Tax=Streptomyces sp. NPDC004284 TaxID=3364695 RepID=UPI0036AA70FD
MPDELRDGEPGRTLRAALSGGRSAGGDGVTRGEQGALAAFRAARDAGLHTSLATRDHDDWTPAVERRRPRPSLKAAVAALVASVTLGGVAVAAGDLSEHMAGPPAPAPEPRPASSAPGPAHEPTEADATAGGEGRASRSPLPGTTAPSYPERDPQVFPGKSHDALCHAFGHGHGHGQGEGKAKAKASNSAAWRRLVAAAGGEDLVPEYCRHEPGPTRAPSAEPHPGEGGARNAPSAHPARGPERPHVDRP